MAVAAPEAAGAPAAGLPRGTGGTSRHPGRGRPAQGKAGCRAVGHRQFFAVQADQILLYRLQGRRRFSIRHCYLHSLSIAFIAAVIPLSE